jgi:pimeloyl-ACP methyl ester carboxylesterase
MTVAGHTLGGVRDPGQLTYEELFAIAVEEARRKGVRVADPTPPIRCTCTATGLGVHFLDWQGDSPEPLLLLHGALLQAHVWDFFSLDMRQDFHIRSIDLPGHGDSDWAADGNYSRARVADHIVSLVQRLDLRSLVLVGHSFGGGIALLAAARFMERVRALVLVDCTMLPTGGPSFRAQVHAGLQTFASLEDFARHIAPSHVRDDLARQTVRLRWSTRQLADGTWTWKYDPALRSPSGPADFEAMWSALGALSLPVLFVRAGRRSHLSEAARERLLTLPNVRLVVVPEAGHNVMSEDPITFTRTVREFLSTL